MNPASSDLPRTGVCSWSLRPESPEDLAQKVKAAGLSAVQLALDPVRSGGDWDEKRTVWALRSAGIQVVSGMMGMRGEDYSTLESIRRTGGVRPDGAWPDNLRAAEETAALARRLDLPLVTFHAGFLPHDPDDPERAVMLDRVRQAARLFTDRGIRVALETGQESAATLALALNDLNVTGIGVNFDPANMILYGMGDPVVSFRALAHLVLQIHVKDALPSVRPGQWGTEAPVGAGAVDWPAFFAAYRTAGLRCDLVIERESGDRRVEDVIAARRLIEGAFAGGSGGGGSANTAQEGR